MPPQPRETHVRYPYPAYNFQLYILDRITDGLSVAAAFSEVSGLQVEVKVIEYRDGADEPFVRKGRGLSSFQNLTFKRGITGQIEFWQWILEGMNGNVGRNNGGVIMLNEDRDPVMTWTFENAWPTKYIGPNFNASTNAAAIETLEIAVERMQIDLS
jgi:phage tail-like protein